MFSKAATPALHKLLGSVARSQHILVAPSPRRLEQILPAAAWEVYGEFIRQSYKRATNKRQQTVHHTDCGACIPESVSDFYTLPAAVVVENATTDGGWLMLIVERLRPGIRGLLAGPSPAVDIRQAGGIGEIPKELERLAANRSSIKPAGPVPLRLIAICDSDARAPGEASDGAKRVQSTAARVGAGAHVLAKRTIENYIPIGALRSLAMKRTDAKAAVIIVESLTREQHDHYPMKDGLSAPDAEVAGSLFPSETQLGAGFGDFMPDLLAHFRHCVEVHELVARDGIGELESLLDLIEENV